MQTRNPFFDDLAKMANGAMGALSGVKDEMEARVRDQIAKILDGMDIPRRDEFEAVKAMAAKAREENEELKKQIADLQARLLNTGPEGMRVGVEVGGGARRIAQRPGLDELCDPGGASPLDRIGIEELDLAQYRQDRVALAEAPLEEPPPELQAARTRVAAATIPVSILFVNTARLMSQQSVKPGHRAPHPAGVNLLRAAPGGDGTGDGTGRRRWARRPAAPSRRRGGR